jgi:hypothetical protein
MTLPKSIPRHLRRYADLPALFRILFTRTLTLLDPKTWDDRNDIFYLSQYKERTGLASLLALCFSEAQETDHHRHVFAKGASGVCIVFKQDALLAHLDRFEGVTARNVQYRNTVQLGDQGLKIADLPFRKRSAFKAEEELRAIYESDNDEHPVLDMPIELAHVHRISPSPWLRPNLADATKNAIRALDGCEKLAVYRSTLLSNERWLGFGKNAT